MISASRAYAKGRPMLWRLRNRFAPWLPLPCRAWNGDCYLVDSDEMGEALFFHRPFEEGERRFVFGFLQPRMVVFDVGANQGLYTLLASQRVGSQGRVVAFEPVPSQLRKLRRNVWLNRRRNVVIEPQALSQHQGLVDMFVALDGKGSYSSLRPPQVDARTEVIKVAITTLDSYVLQHDIRFIDLVKIDVEGGEWDVLCGGIDLFCSSPRPVVMCEFSDRRTRPWGYPAVEVYNFLAARDYKWFSITYAGKLLPSPPKAEYDYDNLVAVPDEKVELVQPFMGDI